MDTGMVSGSIQEALDFALPQFPKIAGSNFKCVAPVLLTEEIISWKSNDGHSALRSVKRRLVELSVEDGGDDGDLQPAIDALVIGMAASGVKT